MNSATRALLNLQSLEFAEAQPEHALVVGGGLSGAVSKLRARVSKQTLLRYDSRKRRYGAHSVVPMKRGICTGCRVAVSRATRKAAEQGLVECEHCGRLLYSTSHHRPLRLEVWAT